MELFKLFGTIAINNDEANQAIDDTVGKAKTSGNDLDRILKKVGSAVAKAFSIKAIADFIVLKNTIKTLVEETNVSYGSRLLDELEIK